mmetsp:Transcript_21903/g.47784  ORF Transcript_21903/g.47784 Transcript_21903/m.47784 type:complete len:187 (+) Transcript_21903:153-713(+)
MANQANNAAADTNINTDFVLASTQPYSSSNMRRARGRHRRRFFSEKHYRDLPWPTAEARIELEKYLLRRRRSWMIMGCTLSLFVITDILMRLWYPDNSILFWGLASLYLLAFFGFFYGMSLEMATQWKLDELVDNLPGGWDDEEEGQTTDTEEESENENDNENAKKESGAHEYEAPPEKVPSHELT